MIQYDLKHYSVKMLLDRDMAQDHSKVTGLLRKKGSKCSIKTHNQSNPYHFVDILVLGLYR